MQAFAARLQYPREFFLIRRRARAALVFRLPQIVAAAKNSRRSHQLVDLFCDFTDRSDPPLLYILGRAACVSGRDLRETSDLLVLAPGPVRQRMALEKDRNCRDGKPQLRRGIHSSHS